MTFPAVETTATSVTSSSLTTHTIDTPAGVVSGDLLIAFIAMENDGADPQYSGWSDGFTEIKDKLTGGLAGANVGVAYKFSDGTEGANITVSSVDAERAAHAMFRISSASLASAPEISAGGSGLSAAPDPDNLIPVLLTRDYLWLVLAGYEKDDETITGFPTNYGSNQVTSSMFSGATIGIATRELAAAAENPGVFSMSGAEEWQAFTLAVTPLGTATLGGTAVVGAGTPIDEFDVVAGGKTINITLTDETWANSGAPFNAIRQDIIDGITSAQSELLGWNNEVRDKMAVTDVVRFSGTLVQVTIPASAAYLLTANETITVTIPASSNLGGQTIVASNTFDVLFVPQGVSLSGDVVPQDFESDIVAGARTLILTANKDTWVAAGAPFQAIRQDIIDGLTSAQSELTGWNNEVRDKMSVTEVARTSDTVVTITFAAQAGYNITADETITATIPASAVVTGGPYVATPTFDIKIDPTAAVSGTVTANIDETDVVAGGKTIIVDIVGDTLQPNGMEFDGARQAIIDNLTSAQSELTGWNNEVRDKLLVATVVRTSSTRYTVTLSAQAGYDITAQETITVRVPSVALVLGNQGVIATPTFNVDTLPQAAATGTITPGSTEALIVAGGETLILTLTDGTWVASGAAFNAQRQAIIDGITSAQSELLGWNNEVRDNLPVGQVIRTSSTVVTVTFPPASGYNITDKDEITVTIPSSAMTGSPGDVVSNPIPAFTVFEIPVAIVTGTVVPDVEQDEIIAGGETIILTLIDDIWVSQPGFDLDRQDLIDGLDSDGVEATGWNAEVRDKLPVTAVVRTSDTVVTITLTAQAGYLITQKETITVTVPGLLLDQTPNDIFGTPTFDVKKPGGTHMRDRRGGKHAEDIFDVNEPDVATFEVNKFD
ncbi:MAG: hypothetical protein KAJ55_14875 [Anaerolineales bacterium]|nr:hypothetical protein [Anaerolineales bacterium]